MWKGNRRSCTVPRRRSPYDFYCPFHLPFLHRLEKGGCTPPIGFLEPIGLLRFWPILPKRQRDCLLLEAKSEAWRGGSDTRTVEGSRSQEWVWFCFPLPRPLEALVDFPLEDWPPLPLPAAIGGCWGGVSLTRGVWHEAFLPVDCLDRWPSLSRQIWLALRAVEDRSSISTHLHVSNA